MRLFKLTISNSLKTASSFFSVLTFQGGFSSDPFTLGNLVRSFLLKEKLIVSDILFFAKKINGTFRNDYRLVSIFSDFEELGQSFDDLCFIIKNLSFVNLKDNDSVSFWRGSIDFSGPVRFINSSDIVFSPPTLAISSGFKVGDISSDSLSIKIIFKVIL
uniref:RNA polymerase alpha subunit n=1 Tax=Lepocinclis steinii TaxID=459226 RepID=A0A3G3LLN9_9EUGL|nr:RNA polymerase alpha subunit [Lepocinclis steinii]AYQ93621.1 RNA polymerase alpha subunit [Lepocinclis steinii]